MPERFLRNDLPFFDIGAGAHGQRHPHGGDRIETSATEWKFDYLCQLFLRLARNLLIKQTDVWIARNFGSRFCRTTKLVGQLPQFRAGFESNEKRFRKLV